MSTLRRILSTIGALCALYTLAAMLFGSVELMHAFVTITAIDHWHPNWPDQPAADHLGQNVAGLAAAVAVLWFLFFVLAPWIIRLASPGRLNTPAAMSGLDDSMGLATAALGSMKPYHPTRAQFHAELCEMLRSVGVSAEGSVEAADMAMLTANTHDPADWAAPVRSEALEAAGITGTYVRVHSRESGRAETAQFLRDYGYTAAQMRKVGDGGTDQDSLNFEGILVWYRTEAHEAEDALIELLIIAHQAHRAAMTDTGTAQEAKVMQRHFQSLGYVCRKLALRGFVPPELDAEVGRDGTATAEELERWAVAQVVAACSPMTRMPLPTVERMTGDTW
ncbi:hypothetical protein [Curtobacterium sp. S6]|uniref:hypothetical protein n=1 Tax=Curtobacterium sp. S6 TaxID=1479623 RepID=UPI0004AA37CF|nr:hypothetical protein [Curtobacterium sp. S6]